MSTNSEAARLLEQVAKIAPDESVRRRAMKMRARMRLPMTVVLKKVPGDSVIAKAAYLKVTRQAVYSWMDGSTRPSRKMAKRLAEVTSYDAALIRGSVEPSEQR